MNTYHQLQRKPQGNQKYQQQKSQQESSYINKSQRYIKPSQNLTPSRRYINNHKTPPGASQKTTENSYIERLISPNHNNTPRKIVQNPNHQRARVHSPYVPRNQINLLKNGKSASPTPNKPQKVYNVNLLNSSKNQLVENSVESSNWTKIQKSTPVKKSMKNSKLEILNEIHTRNKAIPKPIPTGEKINLLDGKKSPKRNKRSKSPKKLNRAENKNYEVRYVQIKGNGMKVFDTKSPRRGMDNFKKEAHFNASMPLSGRIIPSSERYGFKKPVLRHDSKCIFFFIFYFF